MKPKFYPELTDKVSEILKYKKLKFNFDNEYELAPVFKIFVGSGEAFIQIEYSDVPEYPEPDLTFYSKPNNNGNPLYESIIEYTGEDSDIEGELEQLIDYVKQLNQIISKIENKINQITELCEEMELDPEVFITVNYDFEE